MDRVSFLPVGFEVYFGFWSVVELLRELSWLRRLFFRFLDWRNFLRLNGFTVLIQARRCIIFSALQLLQLLVDFQLNLLVLHSLLGELLVLLFSEGVVPLGLVCLQKLGQVLVCRSLCVFFE